MDDCPICPRMKRGERSRPSPRRRRYRAASERSRRFSPIGCDPCSREDLRIPRKAYCVPCDPCPLPCREKCCPGRTESGLLNTIRSSLQRLFTGRKTNQLYMYTMSQLRCIEQLVEKLEDETCCFERMIKEALECECGIDCSELQCSMTSVLGRVESVKCDVMCARNCYDPCRDRCEFEFICRLMKRVCSLERHLQEMCLYVECLQGPGHCDPCCNPRAMCRPNYTKCCCSPCKSPCCGRGCSKPCDCSPCCKLECDTGCRTTCCEKPKCCKPRNLGKMGNICIPPKGLCRTSSVIPVGVMLVKL